MECEVSPILLQLTSAGNLTQDLLILNPMPYPLGHMLVPRHLVYIFDFSRPVRVGFVESEQTVAEQQNIKIALSGFLMS